MQWVASADFAVGFTNLGTDTSSLANIIGSAAQANQGDLTNLSAARVPSGMQMVFGDFSGNNRFGALISALAKDADTNVLSTPTVVTLDNEQAEIIVGQNVPFVTGNYTTGTTSGSSSSTVGNPFQTINREDVGIKPRSSRRSTRAMRSSWKSSRKFPAWCLRPMLRPRSDYQQAFDQNQGAGGKRSGAGARRTDR